MGDDDFETPDFNKSVDTTTSDSIGDNVMRELDNMAGLSDEPPIKKDVKPTTKPAQTADTDDAPPVETETAAPKTPANAGQRPQRGQAGVQKSLLNTFLQENETGDLIDHNNNVIATKGPQRLYFERMKKEGRDALHRLEELAVSQYETREALQGLYEDYKELEKNKTVDRFADLTMNDDETAIIRRLVPMFRTDPVAGIKALLTEVSARGTDLKKLGMNDALDVATVRNMVEQAVGRATAAKSKNIDTISDEQTSQQRYSPQEQAERFLTQFPDAQPYVAQIAEAAKRFPQMSLPQIWLQLNRAIIASQERKQTQPAVRKQVKPRTATTQKPRAQDARRSYRDIAADLLKETQNG